LGPASQLATRALGLDVSEKAVTEAASRGLPARLGSYEDLQLGEEQFTLIRMWHVLEHVPDPVRALSALRAHLDEKGRLVVAVPNAASALADVFGTDWFQLDLPRHLWGFTESSLRCALCAAGYDVEKILYDGKGYSVYQSMAYALRRRESAFGLPASPAPDVLVGLDALAEVWNSQQAGDSMVFVASLRTAGQTGD